MPHGRDPDPNVDVGAIRRLRTRIVEKPWGRTDIPAAFGDLGGRRVGEIWFEHPDDGDAAIMVKFLFTSERLSIQVHPDEAAAQAAGYPHGKDECWLVLDAAPDAKLGVGLTRETTRQALHDAALDGSIVDMIDWRPSQADDFVYNRAGTIHAIGGGLTLVEVQQNVDCTYRLHDYARPRELHLEAGLNVAVPGPVADARNGRVDPAISRKLVSGPHFHLLHLAGPVDRTLVEQAAGELTFVPLSDGCHVAGEAVTLSEAVLLGDPAGIDIAPGARALLCWAA